MKLTFHAVLFITAMCFYTSGLARISLLDSHSPETSTTFQYFGSSLNETLTKILCNPEASGANTSEKVIQSVKPPQSQIWAAEYLNPIHPEILILCPTI